MSAEARTIGRAITSNNRWSMVIPILERNTAPSPSTTGSGHYRSIVDTVKYLFYGQELAHNQIRITYGTIRITFN